MRKIILFILLLLACFGFISTAFAQIKVVPNTRTITINGITQDLSANQTWTVSTGPTYTAGYGISIVSSIIKGDTSVLASKLFLASKYLPITYTSSIKYQTVLNAGSSTMPQENALQFRKGLLVSDNGGVSTIVDVDTGSVILSKANANATYQPKFTGTGYSKFSSGTLSYVTSIPNADLANSTISGVSLGSNLFNHVAGYGLIGTNYNGSASYTWTADSTVLASKPYVTAKLAGKQNTLTAGTGITISTNTISTSAILPSTSATLTSLAINGTGGNGFVTLGTQTTSPSAPSGGVSIYANTNNHLTWRTSGNNYEKTFAAPNNSANHTYTFPNRDIKADSLTTSTSTALNGIIQGNGNNISTAPTTGSGNIVLQTSPSFSGTPTVPTQTFNSTGNQIANIRYINQNDTVLYLIGNATTTSTVASTISGSTSGTFSFTGSANAVYMIDGSYQTSCSSTGGIKYTTTVPGSSTLDIVYFGQTSSGSVYTNNVITGSGTLTTAYNTVGSTGFMTIKGLVTMDGSGGTVNFQFASTTGGQTSTIGAAGSYIRIKRIK